MPRNRKIPHRNGMNTMPDSGNMQDQNWRVRSRNCRSRSLFRQPQNDPGEDVHYSGFQSEDPPEKSPGQCIENIFQNPFWFSTDWLPTLLPEIPFWTPLPTHGSPDNIFHSQVHQKSQKPHGLSRISWCSTPYASMLPIWQPHPQIRDHSMHIFPQTSLEESPPWKQSGLSHQNSVPPNPWTLWILDR